MQYKIGDTVYILHDDNGTFHIGEVTGITPTGRINVRSVCFTDYHGQFTPEGRLRGPDHHGGTHLVPAGDNPPKMPEMATRPFTPYLLLGLRMLNRAANGKHIDPAAIRAAIDTATGHGFAPRSIADPIDWGREWGGALDKDA